MKKTIITLTILLLTLILQGCKNQIDDEKTIHIIATQVPHEEILKQAEPILKEKGYKLKITVTDDYSFPNKAVAKMSADANFFQHIPFLDQYNSQASENEKLIKVADVHIEPLIGYSKTLKNINEVTKESNILISNSLTDHGRILIILQKEGLITLKDGVNTLTATLKDITEESILQPENFKQVIPELLTSGYKNEKKIDLAFINGNFALEANLNQTENIIEEKADNNPYVNVLAVLKGRETLPKIQELIKVLTSQEIKAFIKNKYQGSVIPA